MVRASIIIILDTSYSNNTNSGNTNDNDKNDDNEDITNRYNTTAAVIS